MLHKLPPITVGISFYNAEDTILDAVRSVFAQTHQDWELILIDDGSTDRSLKLARSINDPRVKVISDGENKRLAARLNQLAELASHEFIARMDADDLMSPDRLRRQLEVLIACPEVDLVSTGLYSLTDDNKPVGVRSVGTNHLISAEALLMGGSGIVHASLLGRSEWFKRNKYKESMIKSQDTNLWVRAYAKGDLRVAFIRDGLYYYREDGNVTRSQLLTAYAMGRHTIILDAKHEFSLHLKIKALVKNIIKTSVVLFFPRLALQIARKRRNANAISPDMKHKIEAEVLSIRSVTLPLAHADGDDCGR